MQGGPAQRAGVAQTAGGKHPKHHRSQGKGAGKDAAQKEEEAEEENIPGASRVEPRPFSPGTGRKPCETGRAWERERV
jgi:hypothetical protein